ncbi:MAG TPA: hypothetical protein VNQ53_08585 [Nocardioides sp.]|nr:hypothetical protein [Nocardioides sp.]
MLSVRVLPRRGILLRAALATIEILTLLVAAHSWAGGRLPATGWMVATAALVFAAGTMVLRGRVPLWAMVPALVVAQFLLHSWMSVLGPSSGHAHGPHLDLTWQMVLAHVAGGLATALIWELRRRAVEVVLTWSEIGVLPVPALRRTVARTAPVLPLRRPLVVVPLRGPPVGLGSVA